MYGCYGTLTFILGKKGDLHKMFKRNLTLVILAVAVLVVGVNWLQPTVSPPKGEPLEVA